MSDYKPLRVISDVPRTHLTHPEFRYTNAASTNVAATFARIRRAQQAQTPAENVRAIKRRAKG